MFLRLTKLSQSNSFFLFGARGTGKSTLLRQTDFLKKALYIDLLKPNTEERYALNPSLLEQHAHALPQGSWVVVDEIQKIPKLLDVIHSVIEEKRVHFAITGSSSRKLKRGGANLLAGRAFVHSLFPLTSRELKDSLDLDHALKWGTLPRLFEFSSDLDKSRYLRSYVQTYVREEIVVEQLVRNLDPFRLFLPMASQMNGHIINYSKIARETGVDHKTIQTYYQILVDTNLGFFLNPFGRSVRKVQTQSPKFYFFDTGVKRALDRSLGIPLQKSTSDYGDAFESWFITECLRLNEYGEHDFKFSYLRTKDDAEVDLIVERPGEPDVVLEIKSSQNIQPQHLKSLIHFKKDFPKAKFICACQVSHPQRVEHVEILPWSDALAALGL